MGKNYVRSVVVLLVLTMVGCTNEKDINTEAKIENKNEIQNVVSVMEAPLVQEVEKSKEEKETIHSVAPVEVKPKRPEIKDVNLDVKLLDYIWNKANENDFAYTLILSMAKQESNLNQDRLNHNNNGTTDGGLMQINSRSVKWLAELADIKNPNVYNDYHSIDMAIAYLVEERNYWRKQRLSEEQVFFATVLSYNRGRAGATSYIRRNGWHSEYVKNVLKYKSEFEQNIL